MTYPVIKVTKDTTDQELFNAVVTHLLGMTARCMSDTAAKCVYRGPGDTACAVGALMTDAEARRYDSGIEEVLDDYTHDYELGEVPFSPRLERMTASENLLDNLQGVRDYRGSWDSEGGLGAYGVKRLIDIADMFDLKAPKALRDKRVELDA